MNGYIVLFGSTVIFAAVSYDVLVFIMYVQLLPKIYLHSNFCHNYLHTPVILNWLPYA